MGKSKSIMRAAIYARVSTDDKRQTTATQTMQLKKDAAKRGWKVAEIYIDHASGAKASRPALDRLMAAAFRREFDVVLVARFDRFARSTKHLVTALDEFKAMGIDFVSMHEQLDTSSPMGKAMFVIISAFAELERSTIRERVKDGLSRARAQGVRLGRPVGSVTAHEDQIIRLLKAGKSIRATAAECGVSPGTVMAAKKRQTPQGRQS